MTSLLSHRFLPQQNTMEQLFTTMSFQPCISTKKREEKAMLIAELMREIGCRGLRAAFSATHTCERCVGARQRDWRTRAGCEVSASVAKDAPEVAVAVSVQAESLTLMAGRTRRSTAGVCARLLVRVWLPACLSACTTAGFLFAKLRRSETQNAEMWRGPGKLRFTR